MGNSRWDASDWTRYSSTHVDGKEKAEHIYTSSTIHKDLNPNLIDIRESRDSENNPNSNAIITALDVTGSMGLVLLSMMKGLGTFINEIYDRKPVTDPHLMFMGIGDVHAGDHHPLQVTQFEADIRIAEQLQKIYLERGGGGNNYESYALAWYFAAVKTSIDCFEKRGKKGYLFTIGDEEPTPYLTYSEINSLIKGEADKERYECQELLMMAMEKYHVYHIMVEEGNYFRSRGDRVVDAWTNILGQRAVRLSDCTKLPETLVSLIQVNEGIDKSSVIKSWDGKTSAVVARAVGGDVSAHVNDNQSGVIVF